MSEDESSEQSVDTSVNEESTSQVESSEAAPQEAAPEPKEEVQVPFHEHPRFKELIEERRTFKEQLDKQSGYMEALQRELQASRSSQQPKQANEPKYKPLLEHLKSINPEFAAYQEELMQRTEAAEKRAGAAEEVQKRLEAYEQREFQSNAMNRLNNLYETNKVPETLRTRYEREVRALAYEKEVRGEKLTLKDVDGLFSQVHNEYTPFLESLKRETLKGYVQGKKSDSTPAQATGGAAFTPGTKKFAPVDSQEGFEQTKKWMADQLRAAKKQI